MAEKLNLYENLIELICQQILGHNIIVCFFRIILRMFGQGCNHDWKGEMFRKEVILPI